MENQEKAVNVFINVFGISCNSYEHMFLHNKYNTLYSNIYVTNILI